MKKLIACLFFVFCAVTATWAQGDPVHKSTVQYALVDGQELFYDVYQTQNATTEQPIFVWMHGGGFSGGSRDHTDETKFMKRLASEGYRAISISYRLLQKGDNRGFSCDCPAKRKREIFREAANDLWRALIHIENTFKPNQLIVGGSSAGAEAVLNAVYGMDWVFEEESDLSNKARDIELTGVVSLAGAMVDERYLREQAPPAIFFHGMEDNLVPYATAPHHYCSTTAPGFIILDGSLSIAESFSKHSIGYALFTFPKGNHDIARIPFEHMDLLLENMRRLFLNGEHYSLNQQMINE